MSIIVKFYDTGGHELPRRKFQKGERICINTYVTGASGLPEIFPATRCDVVNGAKILFTEQKSGNLYGVADFNFQVPDNASGKATVKINVDYSLAGSDTLNVPISFGTTEPSALPDEQTQGGGLPWYVVPAAILLVGVAALGGYKASRLLH